MHLLTCEDLVTPVCLSDPDTGYKLTWKTQGHDSFSIVSVKVKFEFSSTLSVIYISFPVKGSINCNDIMAIVHIYFFFQKRIKEL